MVIVLKQFPWSSNGYDVEILNPGAERDFGAALAGLASEGFVSSGEEIVEPAPEPVVDEPEIEVVPEVTAEPAEPEVTPEPPTITEPAPEPVRQPRKRK